MIRRPSLNSLKQWLDIGSIHQLVLTDEHNTMLTDEILKNELVRGYPLILLRVSQNYGNIVTGSRKEKTVKLHNIASNELLFSIEHKENIKNVILSGDMSKIATLSNDNAVKIHDTLTGDLFALESNENVYTDLKCFSPDNLKIGLFIGKNIMIYSTNNSDLPLHIMEGSNVLFSADSQKVVINDEDGDILTVYNGNEELLSVYGGYPSFSPDSSNSSSMMTRIIL